MLHNLPEVVLERIFKCLDTTSVSRTMMVNRRLRHYGILNRRRFARRVIECVEFEGPLECGNLSRFSFATSFGGHRYKFEFRNEKCEIENVCANEEIIATRSLNSSERVIVEKRGTRRRQEYFVRIYSTDVAAALKRRIEYLFNGCIVKEMNLTGSFDDFCCDLFLNIDVDVYQLVMENFKLIASTNKWFSFILLTTPKSLKFLNVFVENERNLIHPLGIDFWKLPCMRSMQALESLMTDFDWNEEISRYFGKQLPVSTCLTVSQPLFLDDICNILKEWLLGNQKLTRLKCHSIENVKQKELLDLLQTCNVNPNPDRYAMIRNVKGENLYLYAQKKTITCGEDIFGDFE